MSSARTCLCNLISSSPLRVCEGCSSSSDAVGSYSMWTPWYTAYTVAIHSSLSQRHSGIHNHPFVHHPTLPSHFACAFHGTRMRRRCRLRRCIRNRNVREVILTNSLDGPCVCCFVNDCLHVRSSERPHTNSSDESKDGQSSYSISHQVWLSCSVECCGRTIAIVVVGRLWQSIQWQCQ